MQAREGRLYLDYAGLAACAGSASAGVWIVRPEMLGIAAFEVLLDLVDSPGRRS